MLVSVLFIIGAIIILYFAAELTLNASEKFGEMLGLSPLVIGMVLIGFGTSLPELFVGHIAGVRGESGVAMGSLIGSNIANMFLILGICGLFAKLSVFGKSLREHLIVHCFLGGVLFFVLSQKELNLITSSPLLALIVVYLFFIFKDMQREKKKRLEEQLLVLDPDAPKEDFKGGILFFKMLVGFGLLYVGGELLVKGGSDLGMAMGIDPYIISAIFIAFGTSFPELVTALMAAFKNKDTDLIIGNIVGSNIFNCAFILGSLGIYDFQITQSYTIELWSLVGGALVLLLLNIINKPFYRFTSILFMVTYGFIVVEWLK